MERFTSIILHVTATALLHFISGRQRSIARCECTGRPPLLLQPASTLSVSPKPVDWRSLALRESPATRDY